MRFGMDFRRKYRRRCAIPTTSMGDIAFLLLIFFMVTAIFHREAGLAVDLPRAASGEPLGRQPVVSVFIDRQGRIVIDGRLVRSAQVAAVIEPRIRRDPSVIIALQADQATPYGVVSDVLEELKSVNALRVSFGNRPAPAPVRRR